MENEYRTRKKKDEIKWKGCGAAREMKKNDENKKKNVSRQRKRGKNTTFLFQAKNWSTSKLHTPKVSPFPINAISVHPHPNCA